MHGGGGEGGGGVGAPGTPLTSDYELSADLHGTDGRVLSDLPLREQRDPCAPSPGGQEGEPQFFPWNLPCKEGRHQDINLSGILWTRCQQSMSRGS